MDSRNYTCDDQPVPRPATGKTPNRNLRVEDTVWLPARAKAEREGCTLTEALRAFLICFRDLAVAWPDYVRACTAKQTTPAANMRRHIAAEVRAWQSRIEHDND